MTTRASRGTNSAQIVIALDKFKGTIGSLEAGRTLSRGITAVDPEFRVVVVPMADGGEGTLGLLRSHGFEAVHITVTAADGVPSDSWIAWDGSTAVVESASICGPPPSRRVDALRATSYGVGEAVLAALDLQPTEIVVALGGSATTDGGVGFLAALGVRCLAADGTDIPPGGAGLSELAHVDWSHLDPRLSSVRLRVACDVQNPLYGPLGAATVFAPQKGATESEVSILDSALRNLAAVIETSDMPSSEAHAREAVAHAEGAGAAGGLGYACFLLGASYVSGAEFALGITNASSAIRDSNLVITGEGSLDHQSVRGKAPSVVAAAAADAGVPVIAVVGRNLLTGPELRDAGFTASFALVDRRPGCGASHTLTVEALTAVAEEIGQVLATLRPDATWNGDQRRLATGLDRPAMNGRGSTVDSNST